MKRNKGFTLIELLVVIAIIGLLATLAVVALNSAREKSRNAKRISDIKQIQTALELFYNDEDGYPDGSTAGEEMTAGTDLLGPTSLETYMAAIPTAPTPTDGDCSAAQNTYTYTQTGSGTGYTLRFCLGSATGGLSPSTSGDSPYCTATESGITCVDAL